MVIGGTFVKTHIGMTHHLIVDFVRAIQTSCVLAFAQVVGPLTISYYAELLQIYDATGQSLMTLPVKTKHAHTTYSVHIM